MAKATPFDDAVDEIRRAGYHNQRLETHSDAVSRGLLRDLTFTCGPLASDLKEGVVRAWFNVSAPGDRERKVDLFVGETTPGSNEPDISRVRLALENKSVLTAHRNRTNRFDDLKKTLDAIHSSRAEAILIGTVLVGVAPRYLNVADRISPFCEERGLSFERDVKPRLSSGDQSLWNDFKSAVSKNSSNAPKATVDHLRTLPVRDPSRTHEKGYDALLLVPVIIDNVSAPSVPRPNSLGIDVDAEYARAIDRLCRAYTSRWHF